MEGALWTAGAEWYLKSFGPSAQRIKNKRTLELLLTQSSYLMNAQGLTPTSGQ